MPSFDAAPNIYWLNYYGPMSTRRRRGGACRQTDLATKQVGEGVFLLFTRSHLLDIILDMLEGGGSPPIWVAFFLPLCRSYGYVACQIPSQCNLIGSSTWIPCLTLINWFSQTPCIVIKYKLTRKYETMQDNFNAIYYYSMFKRQERQTTSSYNLHWTKLILSIMTQLFWLWAEKVSDFDLPDGWE